MLENENVYNQVPDMIETVKEKVFYCGNILEQIFKFLPTTELVNARLVCQCWKLESDRILKSRQLYILLRTEADIQAITEILDTIKEQGSTIVFNKFTIIFERIALEQTSVRNFLDSHGLSIEGLRLRFDCYLVRKNTRESFKNLIEKQVCDLKSLEFFGFSEDLWQAKDLFKESSNLLPKLNFIGCFTVHGYRHAVECPLYLSLFSRLTSVTKMAINCSNYWKILFVHAAHSNNNQLRQLFSQVQEISTFFPDFANLPITRNCLHGQICQQIDDRNVFILMPQLCPNVRILRLCIDVSVPRSDVCNLLKKYANQLENLCMSAFCGVTHRYWENNELENEYDIDNQPIEENDAQGNGNNENRLENVAVNNQNNEQINQPLSNEIFSTTVFKKLRVLSTGVNIFVPPTTVTPLFHKQLPALASLKVNFAMIRIPPLVWEYDFSVPLHTLIFTGVAPALDLLSIGRIFSKVKTLMIKVPNDDVLRLVFKAFPNIEELHISGDFTDDGIMGVHIEGCLDFGIADLTSLRYLWIRANLSDAAINWLRQFESITCLKVENLNDTGSMFAFAYHETF